MQKTVFNLLYSPRDGQNGKFSIYNAHNAHYVHYAHNEYHAFWPKLRHNFTGIIISARITLCALYAVAHLYNK